MSGEQNREIALGMREMQPNPSKFTAQTLKDLGVEVAFGVHGGHIWQMCDEMSNLGIRMVTVRHEQAGVYAAEAYSKVTGKIGVCYATAGPGVANCTSALQQCWLSRSPVLLLTGGNEFEHDDTFTLQPADSVNLFTHITKWTKRITHPCQLKQFITRGYKTAMTYPQGPVCLEISHSVLYTPIPPMGPASIFGEHPLFVDKWLEDRNGKVVPAYGADPKLIGDLVDRIYKAERPVMLAGDGIHWANAQDELREFVELTQVPTSVRRISRGALDETNPLYWSSRIGSKVLQKNDLTLVMGMKVGFFDGYGRPWRNAIQINESPDQIVPFFKTDMAVVGSPKVVMRQMIDYIKAKGLKPPAVRSQWSREVVSMQKSTLTKIKDRAETYSKHKPIHFGYLSKVVWDVCEDLYGGMNRVIMDGYTFSGWFPPYMTARYSGQYQDSSEQAGVGHGVGMAIGTAFADPETRKRPVIVLMGDSGMGLGGMDIEVAIRYRLPIVFIVGNNNGWLTGMKAITYGKDWGALGPQDREHGSENISNIAYDKMFEVIGCHAEGVTDPAGIRPALERACRAAEKGQTAVVNVYVDPTVTNREVYSGMYAAAWLHIPWDKLPKRGKAIRRNTMPMFPWDQVGVPPMPMPDYWEPIPEDEQIP
ncbi:MAG: thiamine pyrophosphate-binding protein [Deltaproteobacteria bacterium]|nr:thiamine pyrophosphate-binding protein [Deltaproteobacteria bacterium]